VRQTVRKTALVGDQVLVLATPVDTGRARAGWIVSLGAPSSETPQTGESGDIKEQRGATAAAKALAQARKAIGAYEDQGSIHITNNVHYVPILDKGRVGNRGSRQAPDGMTKAGLAAMNDVIRRARLLE